MHFASKQKIFFHFVKNKKKIHYILTEQWLQKETQNYYRFKKNFLFELISTQILTD